MNSNMNPRAEPPAVSQRWRYLLLGFLSCRYETRPADKTRASLAVSDNGKEEEEEEQEQEEEEEEGAKSKEQEARSSGDCMILEGGGGGVINR